MPGYRRFPRLLPLATLALTLARPASVAAAEPAEGIAPPISFPVLGPVEYTDGWGNCRDGCSRRHKGTDILGVRLQPLLAATDGTLTRVRHEPAGKAGATITLTAFDGWSYNYFHVNNDTPGSDDGDATPEWQTPPGLGEGSVVQAGQVIGYMGDSGNAEGSTPHLHFEIHQPDGTAVNPHPSLAAAHAIQACSGVPAAGVLADATALAPDAAAIAPRLGTGQWVIDGAGHVFAEGDAALVAALPQAACGATVPVAVPDPAPADPAPADPAPPAPDMPPAPKPTAPATAV